MMFSPVSDSENLHSTYLNQNNETEKGKSETYNHSKYRSNYKRNDSTRYPKSSSYLYRPDRRRNTYYQHRNNNKNHSREKKYHKAERSSNDQNDFTRESLYNPYIKPDSRAIESSSLITQIMKEKGYELDTDLLKSIASTYVDIQEPKNEENFKCSEKEVVKVEEIKPEVIDSLTKLSVNLPSKYQIQKSTKVNVLSLPMPPVSTNSFDISPSPEVDVKDVTVTKIPLPQDSAKDNIKLGESYFKDNKYNNIKASDIFSPAPKVRPSIIIPKRPSVIKSTPPIDHPNRELNEFNKLLKVGEGSYGTVYKALDIRSNELVAMKRVRMEHEHEGFPITAVREIKILRQLNHKNVIHLRDIISDQKDIYLVFEYMNHDLMGLLENEFVRFNEQSIYSITKQILEGLEYCHAKNFLHRDLKCSNILLNNKGEVKLGDFGLSRLYNAAFPGRPYTNKVISLWYRPIELLLGEESYGFGIDIWSCGCILAELFSRRPLFLANSEVELIEAITNLCGTPCTYDWPEVGKLPQYRTLAMKSKRRKLLEVYKQVIPDLALILLDQMLKLNPMKRITASEALKSHWIIFNDEKSLTSAPLSLPSWIDCHELQARMKNKDKR